MGRPFEVMTELTLEVGFQLRYNDRKALVFASSCFETGSNSSAGKDSKSRASQ